MNGKKRLGFFVILTVIIILSFLVAGFVTGAKREEIYTGTFVLHGGEISGYLYKTSYKMFSGFEGECIY